MAFLEDSIQQLKEGGYKITGPRMAVLEILAVSQTPLSAYDIEERLPKNIPVNVVTIYRVLDVFQELGMIHRIHTKEGYVRCNFEGKKGCHYFAVCGQCGRTSEFLHHDPCILKKIVPKNLPFKNLKHIAEISGSCDLCSASKP